MLTRRGLLRGLGAVLAAPAIVRASSLMAISQVPETDWVFTAGGFPLPPLKVEGGAVAFDDPVATFTRIGIVTDEFGVFDLWAGRHRDGRRLGTKEVPRGQRLSTQEALAWLRAADA